MRQISMSLTAPQVLARTKTETRRLGWLNVKPGDRLQACRKIQGRRRLPDGTVEPIEVLAVIEITETRREPLNAITREAVEREGFPGKSARWFVDFFAASMKVEATREVTVLCFRYVDEEGDR